MDNFTLTQHHAMQAYRCRWMVSFTPRLLCPQEKSPWNPQDRRLGGPQSRSGGGDEERNSQPLPGLEPPIIQAVAQRYTTELSRLLVTPLQDVVWFSEVKCKAHCRISSAAITRPAATDANCHTLSLYLYCSHSKAELTSSVGRNVKIMWGGCLFVTNSLRKELRSSALALFMQLAYVWYAMFP
jgi:hypothetical protein